MIKKEVHRLFQWKIPVKDIVTSCTRSRTMKIFFNSFVSADTYVSYNLDDEYMGLYFHVESSVKVNATYEFTIKSYSKDEVIRDYIEYYFPSHADFGWGCPHFISKYDLQDPAKGFIKKGSIIIDIDVHLYVHHTHPSVTSPMLSISRSLFESKQYSDFTLIVDEKEIKVHKCVLGIASPVFDRMFNSECIEAKEDKSVIKEFDFLTVEVSVKLVYGFEILHDDLDIDVLLDLYRFAHQYEIKTSLVSGV